MKTVRIGIIGLGLMGGEIASAMARWCNLEDFGVRPEFTAYFLYEIAHGKGIKPHQPLEQDLVLTEQAMSYDGAANRRSRVEVRDKPLAATGASGADQGSWPTRTNGLPDFQRMDDAQRLQHHRIRIAQQLGETNRNIRLQ